MYYQKGITSSKLKSLTDWFYFRRVASDKYNTIPLEKGSFHLLSAENYQNWVLTDIRTLRVIGTKPTEKLHNGSNVIISVVPEIRLIILY